MHGCDLGHSEGPGRLESLANVERVVRSGLVTEERHL